MEIAFQVERRLLRENFLETIYKNINICNFIRIDSNFEFQSQTSLAKRVKIQFVQNPQNPEICKIKKFKSLKMDFHRFFNL